MKQRVITALMLAPLVLAAILLLPKSWLMPLVAAALLGGLWEWTRLIGIRSHSVRALILLLHAGVMAWLAWRGKPLIPWVALAGVAWWLLALAWLRVPQFAKADTAANRVFKSGVGALLVIPALCAFALLHDESASWALYGLMLVWAADTFAYFAGRRFGGAKLAPSISPGKTWEGAIGACVGVVLYGITLRLGFSFTPVALPSWILALLAVTAISIIGDLYESMLKRQAGIKDSSNVLPGHGGVLDRIDSLTSTLPVVALLWLLVLRGQG